MEEWREIKDFPGYQISNTGKVRSRVNNRHGLGTEYHELSPYTSQLGYKSIQMGRGNRRSIHQLVASAFIPNPCNLPLVRHLDDNPRNNNVDNLAWGTQTDNMQDCVKHGRLVGDTRAAIESRKKKVIARSLDGKKELIFDSVSGAARVLDLWPEHVSSVARGKLRQTGGWKFEFIDKEVI